MSRISVLRRLAVSCLSLLMVAAALIVFGSADGMSAELGNWRRTGGAMKSANFRSAVLLTAPGCGANCDKVFAANGGWWGTSRLSQLYDPKTDQWELTEQLPPGHPGHIDGMFTLLTGPGCGPHCGKVLAVGGQDDTTGAPSLHADLYDPAANSWSPLPPMLWGVVHGSATTLPDGRVLVLGYHDASTYSGRIRAQIFDPAAGGGGEWKETDRSKFALVGGWTANVISGTNCAPHCGKVLVAGNFDNTFSATNSTAFSELFDPNIEGVDFPAQKGRWALTGAMNVPRREHAAASLPDGRVLAVGGNSGLAAGQMKHDAAETYDPATGKWTLTGQMAAQRTGHGWNGMTLTPVKCGVLAAGGGSSLANTPGGGSLRGPTVREAELFIPAASNGAGVWTATGPLNDARGNHSATALPDGQVLVAGGQETAPYTSELYTPGDLCSLKDADLVLPPIVTGVVPANGPTAGGTPVRIIGRNFTGALAVRFDGIPATGLSVVSDSEIGAASPAHAEGAVHVTVETPAGTSAVSPADQFTYVAPAVTGGPGPQGPEVLGIDPRSGPVQGGTQVAVSGTNLGGASAVLFDTKAITLRCNGQAGSGASPCFDQSSNESLSVFTPAATRPGQVHIQVQTPIGSSPRTAADLFEYVSPKPPLDEPVPLTASAAANSGAVSGGGSPMTPAPPGGAFSVSPGASSAGNSVTSGAGSQASLESMVVPVPVSVPGAAPLPGGATSAVPGLAAAPRQAKQQVAPQTGSTYNMVRRQDRDALGLLLAAWGLASVASIAFAASRRGPGPSSHQCLSDQPKAAYNAAW